MSVPTFTNGWYDVTPEMACQILRRNRANRKLTIKFVRKYARSMTASLWRGTGEPIIIDKEGYLQNAQHRLWALMLSGATARIFIVADVDAEPDLFAFIDNGKVRSHSDAIYTAGLGNGASSMIAAAVKLAYRYDQGAFKLIGQPRIRDLEPIEVVDYVRQNSGIPDAAHILGGSYPKAMAMIGHKGVATFFAWKVTDLHGKVVLAEFLEPLGTGAHLDEDSPVLALRNRLMKISSASDDDLTTNQRLWLTLKAFNMVMCGHKMPAVPKRKGGGYEPLTIADNEEFPKFVEPADVAEAAD